MRPEICRALQLIHVWPGESDRSFQTLCFPTMKGISPIPVKSESRYQVSLLCPSAATEARNYTQPGVFFLPPTLIRPVCILGTCQPPPLPPPKKAIYFYLTLIFLNFMLLWYFSQSNLVCLYGYVCVNIWLMFISLLRLQDSQGYIFLFTIVFLTSRTLPK